MPVDRKEMDMKFRLRPLLAAAGFTVVTLASGMTDAHAQLRMSGEAVKSSKSQAAMSLRQPNMKSTDAAVLSFGPANAIEIQSIQERNAVVEQKALQIGVTRKLKDEFLTSPALRWVAHTDGGGIARLVVSSQDAKALRVALDVSAFPDGAELRFVGSANPGYVVYSVGAAEIRKTQRESGSYWTPITEGAEQIIEVYLPPGTNPAGTRISVDAASHIFATPSLGFKDATLAKASGTCNRDVICESQTTAFTNIKNSVAWMQFQSFCDSNRPSTLVSCLCTGTLVNDGDVSTQTPYFYSANHCIGTQTEASTLNTIWGYERATCGGSGSAPTNNVVAGGADLLFGQESTDALLLKLRQSPPAGAYFAGWDANTLSTGTALTSIHHPQGDPKKVTLGQVVGFGTLSGNSVPSGNFITAGWTSGTTEFGSSGSAIFTQSNNEYFLRGGLYGGSAACSNSGNLGNAGNRDYYSRFDQVYPNIRKYLAPDYSGVWWNPNEDGIGLTIAQGEITGFPGVIWYQFDTDRSPVWFILAESAWTGINTFSGSWKHISGPPYNSAAFVQSSKTEQIVGTAAITFNSPTSLTLVYTLPNGVSGTKNLVKLIY